MPPTDSQILYGKSSYYRNELKAVTETSCRTFDHVSVLAPHSNRFFFLSLFLAMAWYHLPFQWHVRKFGLAVHKHSQVHVYQLVQNLK